MYVFIIYRAVNIRKRINTSVNPVLLLRMKKQSAWQIGIASVAADIVCKF